MKREIKRAVGTKEDYIVSNEEIKDFVDGYKDAHIQIKKISSELSLYDFTDINKKRVRIIAIKHCDGSYLEFHSACFHKYTKDFFFVFTEHHGDHIYHKDDVNCIMSWLGTNPEEPKSKLKILYKNRDL